MSGYLRVSAEGWERIHYSSTWSAACPAPDWWIGIDVAWSCDRRALPSAREAAAAWGCSKDKAARVIRAHVEQQAAWEARPAQRAAILAMLSAWSERAPAKRATGVRQTPPTTHDNGATGGRGETPTVAEPERRVSDAGATEERQKRDLARERSSDQPTTHNLQREIPPRANPQQVPLPPTPTAPPVGEKSRPTIADPPPPPKVVRVGAVDVPDELTSLLDQLEVPRCAMPAEAIVNAFGVYSTTELLALPARSFDFGGAAKLALRNRLREYLPKRWGPGVVLGALAPAEDPRPGGGGGPPRTGRRGEALAAQLVASIAASRERADRGVVDVECEEVFEDVRR